MKADDYPMHRALRCSARSKRTGLPCKNPAVKEWRVCRMHGARGGAPPGRAHPNFRHGLSTKQAILDRRHDAELVAECKAMLDAFNDNENR